MFICSILEAFKPYIYIVSRAGGGGPEAKLTKKSNFVKGILNRNAEEKNYANIQNINSIIDASMHPPPREYIYRDVYVYICFFFQ